MWASLKSLIEVWNGWEIRVLALASLKLQVILIVLGSRRKVTKNICVKILVWSAYMGADWVARVALGILAKGEYSAVGTNNNSPTPNHLLQSFWAPFLLLHLGGPDTITAYSLEDNELWLRHLLGLVVQTGVASYVLLKSAANGNGSNLTLIGIAIPVLIAGFIKYGERTWVLRSSSTKSIRDLLLSNPDPGSDYIEALRMKRIDENFVPRKVEVHPQRYSGSLEDYPSQAYYLFNRLKYLFADLILGYYERRDCHSMITNKSWNQAFELVEGELGFLFDVLYTKATAVYSRYGFLLRCASILCSVFALVAFAIFIDEDAYSPVDISITYVLLVGAVTLEVYALILVGLSDWTKLCLAIFLTQLRIGKRWSRSIAKYNLFKFCLRKEAIMWIKVKKLLGIQEMLEKHLNVEHQGADVELQQLIFQQLVERSENINNLFDVNSCKELLNYRGDCVLGKMNCLEPLKWSTIDVEFDHSLLLWHIATQLCYYDDLKELRESADHDSLKKHSKISMCLSDYMLYLLVMRPNMLPKGIGEIRYKDTCAEAVRFFHQNKWEIGTEIGKACQMLYKVDTDLLEQVKGDETKSVLFYGCRLAKQLQNLALSNDWGIEKKWDMINKVWVEMLAYAAGHCGWKEHGQQLRNGGELLTHVCLLMAHLGLSEQYQIQKEYFHFRFRDTKWTLHCPAACDPCLLPALFILLAPYWCCSQNKETLPPISQLDSLEASLDLGFS